MAELPTVPNHFRYCPRCGQSLSLQPDGGRQRATCRACGFIHFSTFSLGVGGIVVRDNKVLFIRRGQDPGKGRWTIPGGYVEQDEPFEEAVVRELLRGNQRPHGSTRRAGGTQQSHATR